MFWSGSRSESWRMEESNFQAPSPLHLASSSFLVVNPTENQKQSPKLSLPIVNITFAYKKSYYSFASVFILEWTSSLSTPRATLSLQTVSFWSTKINTKTHSTSLVFNSKAQTLAISEFVRQSQESIAVSCLQGLKYNPWLSFGKKEKKKHLLKSKGKSQKKRELSLLGTLVT